MYTCIYIYIHLLTYLFSSGNLRLRSSSVFRKIFRGGSSALRDRDPPGEVSKTIPQSLRNHPHYMLYIILLYSPLPLQIASSRGWPNAAGWLGLSPRRLVNNKLVCFVQRPQVRPQVTFREAGLASSISRSQAAPFRPHSANLSVVALRGAPPVLMACRTFMPTPSSLLFVG